jgi:transglutaminase-like putative cysteine protease
MFRFLKNALWVLIAVSQFSCSQKRLVSDERYIDEIEKSFAERLELAGSRENALFGVLSKHLSPETETALKFLYAYMPLSDLADYNGVFFLEGARKALNARDLVPWGEDIPDEIFMHYVLPLRVNNENLDSFRIAYFDEIHDRIRGKNLTDAALEINYWCQEKVSYQPADSRTSAPMSTILSARGRCGEESTLTVAALRTAGIPARQVYTPRWAHSDDNHAWVEVYIDGEWFYMGACEPEPVLDRGWFTEPARRAMLVHTKSFGAPWGDENAIIKHRNFTEVNNLSKYAVTKRIFVRVEDADGTPVPGAIVEYKLYNYAEFYPIAMVPAGSDGMSSLETGMGSLLVWASKDGKYDWSAVNIAETDTVVLTIAERNEAGLVADLDLLIPPVLEPLPGLPDEIIEKNAERVANGNTIRKEYVDSWIKPEEAASSARKIGIDAGKARIIFARSMGNYSEIMKFLVETPGELRGLAVLMLELLPDKDLRDTKASVLSDHLLNYSRSGVKSNSLSAEYILNPRIANEILSPWRGYLMEEIDGIFGSSVVKDPEMFVKFLERYIRIEEDENYYKTPITPAGVFELRVSDIESRAICFVAMCRSAGVPSRLEPSRKIPQYWVNNRWRDVYFTGQENPGTARGFLKITSRQTNPVPEYYTHFTIARFSKGRYITLEYDYNRKAADFMEELELPPGQYMLVTGNRLSDRILSRLTFFELREEEHRTLEIEVRSDTARPGVLGNINLEMITGLFSDSAELLRNSLLNGAVVAWIEPGQEPTRHIFNDLPLLKEELDDWGGSFMFLTVSENSSDALRIEELKDLPDKSFFGTDLDLKAFKNNVSLEKDHGTSLPVIVQCDNRGRIIFISTGYRIGIGETILRNVN